MKIAVLGIGGIGGLVGACLAQKFDDIYFIARGKTLDVIKENGVTLKSEKLGEFVSMPKLVTDNPDEIGIVDALIISTKSYSLEDAVKTYSSIIGKDTVVVPLLNGVAVSEDIEPFTNGLGQIAEGCIYAFSNILSPGIISHIGELLHIDIGFKDNRESENAKLLAKCLNEAGIETVLSNDIMVPVWKKYIMMCGNSCVFSYFDCNAGEVHSDKNKLQFINDVYEELVNVAKAYGVNIPDSLVENYMKTFKNLPEGAITSLYRDIRDGKPYSEFDAIIGKAYRLSQKAGTNTPSINRAYLKYQK